MSGFPKEGSIVVTTGVTPGHVSKRRPPKQKYKQYQLSLSQSIINLKPIDLFIAKKYVPDNGRIQALGYAALHGLSEIIKILLSKGPYADDTYNYAISYGQEPTVMKNLLNSSYQFNVKYNNNYPLMLACKMGAYETVKLLIKAGANPGDRQSNAIILAAESGYDNIVQLLNRHNCNPSAQDNEALITSCKYGQYHVVKVLLKDSRVDPTARNNLVINVTKDKRIIELIKSDDRIMFSNKIFPDIKNLKYAVINNNLFNEVTAEQSKRILNIKEFMEFYTKDSKYMLRLYGIPLQWWEYTTYKIHPNVIKLYSTLLLIIVKYEFDFVKAELLSYVPLCVQDELRMLF
jgi:hypothetical protein